MEFELQETKRIQSTSVRDESEVWILDGSFYKKMTPNEIDSYQLLSSYKDRLFNEANITIPDTYCQISSGDLIALRDAYINYSRIPSDDLYKMSRLSNIKHNNIEEGFGVGLQYNENNFKSIFESLDKFRRITEPITFTYSEDYESNTLELVQKSKRVIDLNVIVNSDQLFDVVGKTQNFFGGIKLEHAHRDLNWNNMALIESVSDKNDTLQIVDWGSFGMAHAGYDEGRIFTRLSLNQTVQKIYVDTLIEYVGKNYSQKSAKEFMASFWRTVAVRGYREIYLTVTGRYEKPVNYKFDAIKNTEDLRKAKIIIYEKFIKSFVNTMDIAVVKLNEMI